MCGRYSLTHPDLQALLRFLGARVAEGDAPLYRPRYNVAPTQSHWVVRAREGERWLESASWGLSAGEEGRLINARSETVDRRPAFREAFEHGRCAVVADGFFEWRGPEKKRQPVWFHRADRQPILMAGVCRLERAGLEFAILTVPSAGSVAAVHDRMPALVSPDRLGDWLAAPDKTLLGTSAAELEATPVSSRLNAVANDDPECLEAAPDDQLTLL